jgi:hypothetical protein
MSKGRLIGGIIILAGFVTAFFGLSGLLAACFLWVTGTAMFAHSFLK